MNRPGRVPYEPIDAGAVARMKPADARVYLVLAAHANADLEAHPGVERIARLAGLTERAVYSALRRLRTGGLLVVIEPGGGYENKTVYRLARNPEPPFTLSASETLNSGALNPERRRTKTLNPRVRNRRKPMKNRLKNTRRAARAAADEPPPDPRIRFFIGHFCEAYEAALGRPYIVTGGKDGANVKRMLSALDRVEICALSALKQSAGRMLDDPWGRERASIGLLSSQLNSWRGEGQGRRTPATGQYHKAVGADEGAYEGVVTHFGGQGDAGN